MNNILRLSIRVAAGLVVMWLSGIAGAAPGDFSSCKVPDTTAPSTCFFDLTASPSSTATANPASAVLNGGMFNVPSYDGDLGHGFIVGTGVFQPFVRIQEQGNGNHASNGVEAGYNTDGKDGNGYPAMVELDNHDKGGSNWNHSIRLGDIPKVSICDTATPPVCTQYYEFLLDTNEQGNTTNSGISLDEFKLFTAATGDIHDFSGADDTKGKTSFQLTGATLRYDMDGSPGGDASILMDYQNFSGSGNGVDLQALVPVANFVGVGANDFLYLYSKFGWTAGQCLEGNGTNNPQPSRCLQPSSSDSSSGTPVTGKAGSLNFEADAGFEEWSIRRGGPTQTPLPSTALLLGLGLIGAWASLRTGRRKS